ncbi:MAG: AsmA family protein [Actinobacteria bacterium]|nr:AsmA family protein [Actinomycetota bacterium]
MPTTDEQKTSLPKKRKFWRRFFRFCLYAGLVFILLLVVAVVAFRIFFPPDKIRALVNQIAEQKISRHLHIGKVSFNPLRGIELSNIQLTPMDSAAAAADEFPVISATINKVILKYSLRGLLKRHLLIREIALESSKLDLLLRPLEADSGKMLSSQAESSRQDSLQQPPLPVSVDLNLFRLENAQIKITTIDSVLSQKLFLGNLNFYIYDLHLPRGNLMEQDSLIKGRINLRCEKTPFSFGQSLQDKENLFATGRVDISADLLIDGLNEIKTNAKIELDRLLLRSPQFPEKNGLSLPFPVSLSLDGSANWEQQSVQISPLAFVIDGNTWLAASLRVDSLMTQPVLDLRVEKGEIPIRQLYRLAHLVLPDSLLPKVFFHNDNAAIRLLNTRVNGPLPMKELKGALNFNAEVEFRNFGITLNHGAIELDNFNATAAAGGQVVGAEIHNLQTRIDVSYDSLALALADTLPIYTGAGAFSAKTELNEKFVPKTASVTFSIAKAMGASISGNIALTGSKSLESLRGKGHLAVKNISTDNLPQSPLSTNANIEVDFSLATLDSISATVNLLSDSLYLAQEEETYVFPPIDLETKLDCRTDTTFQNITIRSLSIRVNDLLRGHLKAQVLGAGKENFSFDLDQLQIRHRGLVDWIPKQFQSQVRELSFSGMTTVTASGTGKVTPKALNYSADVHLKTDRTNISFPPQFLTVSGLVVNIDAHAQSDSGVSVAASVRIDSVALANIRKAPFRNNHFSVNLSSQDFNNFAITKGELLLPDMKAEAKMSANIQDAQKNPVIDADFSLHQEIPDKFVFMPALALQGTNDLQAKIRMDSQFVDITTSVKTKDLSIFLPNETTITNINSDFRIAQKFDLLNKILITSDSPSIETPSEGSIDYFIYRDYYHRTLKNLSHLSIEKVEAAGYLVKNIALEAAIGNGRLQVPTFFGELYGGDFGGRLSLDLAGGNLENANYRLSAHFSGINSALLLKNSQDKKGQGIINANANLFGTGLDPNQSMNIGGYFYITEIGSKVADNLLRSLDPEGADSGIRTTRILINRGFKPKLFSFIIRNGYFYPSIRFAQPWYFPVRLSGGRVELNRIPSEFFIKNAIRQASTTR